MKHETNRLRVLEAYMRYTIDQTIHLLEHPVARY